MKLNFFNHFEVAPTVTSHLLQFRARLAIAFQFTPMKSVSLYP
jgi:hypothetical protein